MPVENTTATDLEQFRDRRRRDARNRRMLNNLPLARRMAARRAAACVNGPSGLPAEPGTTPTPAPTTAQLLGQAMVGLVAAAHNFEQAEVDARFGAFAEPQIAEALERCPGPVEVESAQAEIAAAIASQQRVHELADFLDVPVDALVGGLMDANGGVAPPQRTRSLHSVA